MSLRAKRILWPTDFSQLSLHGGKYARCFRDLFDADLHVIHVVAAPLPLEMSVTIPAEVSAIPPDVDAVSESLAALRRFVAPVLPNHDRVTFDAFYGSATSAICSYAANHAIDLIVISTHGRTGLSHVLIGSTAEAIVRNAPCPVLTVKNPETDFSDDVGGSSGAAEAPE